ncbi:MAG: protein-disulfide reductase DsbD family protein, partial [Hydrogenophaga sp.]|nr:protein-disulfide reductase DsbD family protein [Hydrogenophaga sp.]
MFPTLFNTAIPNTLQRRSGVALRRWLPAMLLALLIALLAPHTAQSQGLLSATAGTTVVQTEQVRAELLAHAPQGAAPGQTVWVGLQLSHQPHWHTYWKNSGDSGLPTELQWTLPAGVSAGDIAWPTPRKFPLGTLANYGFDGTVLLPVPLTIEPGFTGTHVDVKLYAAWLACRQECIPEEGHFTLRSPVQGSTALHGMAFEAAFAAAPASQP